MSVLDAAVVQEVLHREWCAILEVSTCQADDDFFLLGGNSLLAVAFIERVENQLGIEFPAETLFFDGRLGEIVAACSESYAAQPHRA